MAREEQPEHAGRVAIVTGATSGIGITIAERLVADGLRVIITGRSEERGAAVLERLGESARFVAADLTEDGAVDRIVRAAVDAFGRIDVVVNNAAADHTDDLLDVAPADIRAVFESNTFGAMNLLIAAANQMQRQGAGGAVINITSRLAVIGVPTLTIYSASKGALHAFTKAAAVELAPLGIRVNAVAPGPTRTPLYEEWIESLPDPAGEEAQIASSIPLGRIAEPADVAGAVSYLASPDAAYVTGITIPVEGGYIAQ